MSDQSSGPRRPSRRRASSNDEAGRGTATASSASGTPREPNRLPLRAGAMLLLAVAVVCIGLGWRSAVHKDSNGPVTTASTGAATDTGPSSAAPSPSAAASSSVAAAAGPPVCVFNAGSTKGLARKVADQLQAAGWKIQSVGNLQTSSVSDNTVFYTSSQAQYVDKLATEVTASKQEMNDRTKTLASCPDTAIALVVVQ